jgi:putative intracellular protease/amidase
LRILVVLTSHDRLASGRRTGVCLKSFALGYYACVDAGLEVTICSPLGGPAPIAPCSDRDVASDVVQRFHSDPTAREEFSDGLMLSQVCAGDFSAVYYPDGAGARWDLPGDRDSQALICQLHEQRRLCEPDTTPLVAGRRLTAPGRAENATVGLPDDAPSLAQELARLGAICVTGAGAAPFMVQDGGLITGRDADASMRVVQAMLAAAI